MKKIYVIIALVAAVAGGLAVSSIVTGKPAAYACSLPDC